MIAEMGLGAAARLCDAAFLAARVSEPIAKTHVSAILRKLKAPNRCRVIALLLRPRPTIIN
jgi:hypothetical protein